MSESFTRSMLFVPGSRPEMVAKAARSAADAVCLDLEDAVAPARKAESRTTVAQALLENDFGWRPRIVRVNGVETSWTARDVLEIVERCADRIDAIMVPKVRSARDVHFVDTLLTQVEATVGRRQPVALLAQIETASGFVHVNEIAASSPRLTTLIFGAGDYAASMRMPLRNIGMQDEYDASVPGHRWHAAMHGIVAAARANGLQCWDGPCADYRDEAGLRTASRLARAMGFDGKQCIHPAQLEVVNDAFSPGDEEVTRARGVVTAWETAARAGQGAAGVDGVMIDAVNLRMARTILAAHDVIRHRQGGQS